MSSLDSGSQIKTFYTYFRPIAIFFRSVGYLPLNNLHDKQVESLHFKYCSVPVAYALILIMGALTGIGIFIEWENVFSTMETSKSAFMTGYLLLVVGRSFACCILWMRRSKQVVKLIKLLDLFDRTVLEAFHDNCVDSRNSTKWTVIPLISIISLFSLLNMDLTRFFLKFAPVTNSSSYAIIMTFIVISMWQVSPTFLYAYFISAIKENFIRVNKIFVKMFPEVMRGEDLAGIDLEFLANMRLCHGMMADAVKLINKSFGTFLIGNYVFVLVSVVVNLFVILYIPDDFSLVIFTAVLSCVVLIYISHDVSVEVRIII